MPLLAALYGAWLAAASPAGAACGTLVNASPDNPAASIQAALDAAPAVLTVGDHCVALASGTYSEAVSVRNIAPNGFRVLIYGSTTAARPVVIPPALAAAAFDVRSSSVTLEWLIVRATEPASYGILVSSSGVLLSSVAVEGAGNFGAAAVSLGGGEGRVHASSVTVAAGTALEATSQSNDVWRSTFAASGALFPAVAFTAGFNSLRESLASHSASTAVHVGAGAAGCSITLSTLTSGGASRAALYLAGSTANVVSRSYLQSAAGSALVLDGGGSSVSGSSAVALGGAPAAEVFGSSNTILGTRLAGGGAAWAALRLREAASVTLLRSIVDNAAGTAVSLDGSFATRITSSALTGGGAGYGLAVSASSSALVANSMVAAAGVGARLGPGTEFATILLSTIAGGTVGVELVESASCTLRRSYAAGATGVSIVGSTGTLIDGTVAVGSVGGMAVDLRGASVNLHVAGSTLTGAGWGLALRGQSRGAILVASTTIRGTSVGLRVEALGPGAELSGSSVSFSGLQAGATGLQLLTGLVASTFSTAGFPDASAAINVDASLLDPGSAIVMQDARGPRAGPLHESDPGGYVQWPGLFDPPAPPTGFSGAAVSTEAILWTWSDDSANELGYYVISGFSNLSGGLAPNTTYWLQTGLTPNVSTGPLYAEAFNSSGTADSPALSRFSMAAVPASLSFAQVTSTATALSWLSNGNPGGTLFEVQRSSGSNGAFSVIATTSATNCVDGGLTPSTTHQYRLRAYNGDGVPSTYTVTVATMTRPPDGAPPPAPTGFAGTAASVSSILWTWTDNASGEHGYRVVSGALSLSGDLPPDTGSWLQTGLSPNARTGPLASEAFNSSGTAASGPAARYTLAAPPSGSAASSVRATSATISWGLNGNPSGTVAELQRSTDNVTFSVLASTAMSAYTDAGLLGCTSYYFRVRHRNGDDLPSGFDATVNFLTWQTTPAAPGAFSAESVSGNRVRLTWQPSPTEGVIGYRLYYDAGTGSVDLTSPLAEFPDTDSSFTTAVLPSSASYRFVLRALHRCDLEDPVGATAFAGATAAPAAVRAVLREPDAARRVSGDRVTIIAELGSGLESQLQDVRFQFRPAGTAPWTDVPAAEPNHPNPDALAPFFVHWDVTGLAAGDYDLRAVATARDGAVDAAASGLTLRVDPGSPEVTETLAGGLVRKRQALSNGAASTVDAAGRGLDAAQLRVELPAGALNASSVTITVLPEAALSSAPPRGQQALASVAVTLENGQTTLAAGSSARLTFSYPSSVIATERLGIWAFDPASGQWRQEAASVVNASSRTVAAPTTHFSLFALFQRVSVASEDLSSIRVYPVPYKPNSGYAPEGRPWHPRDPNSGIIFDRLPAEVTLRVYTVSGRLITTLAQSGGDGTIRWDARNQDGRDVASGVYLAVLSSPGHKSVVRKVVVLR